MSMKKDLIDTIMEKEFVELTATERSELKEFCASEDEFNQMKEVFVGVESMQFTEAKPRVETKRRLDDLFDQTYPKVAPVWYMSAFAVIAPKGKSLHRQPLMQIAAIGLLFLMLYPFWTTNVQVPTEDSPQVALNEAPSKQPEVNSNVSSDYKAPSVVQDVALVAEKAEAVVISEDVTATVVVASSTPGVDVANEPHPDGVFVAYSLPASETPELFDLLTTTF